MKKEDLVKDLSITKCKTFRGHDGDGYIQCDIKYKGKLIAEMHEDSWGGGYVYNQIDAVSFKIVTDAFKTFPKVPKYAIDDSLDYLVEELFRLWQQKKDEKKGVIIKNNSGFEIKGFQVSIPSALKKWEDALEGYQEIYDKAISEGKKVLNTEYLSSVGIKV
jgi:hypothetical protein